MSMAWIAAQIQSARDSGALESPRLVTFNPRPAGQAINGSATDAVIGVLRACPLRWFNHSELLRIINAGRDADKFSRIALDWALIRLRDWSLIDTAPDESRNPRYLRYRLKQPTQAHQKVED